MKIRLGFVSNSSSSSFICDICNGITLDETDEGINCEDGHLLCQKCLNKYKVSGEEAEANQILKYDINEEYNPNERFNDGDLKIRYCPICQLKVCKSSELEQYLLLKCKEPKDVVLKEIKDKFTSRNEFLSFLNKGNEK